MTKLESTKDKNKRIAQHKIDVKAHNKKIKDLKKAMTPEQRKEYLALQAFNQFDFDMKRKVLSTQGISVLMFYGNNFSELSGKLHGDMNVTAAAILAAMREDKTIYDLFRLLVNEVDKEGVYDVTEDSIVESKHKYNK